MEGAVHRRLSGEWPAPVAWLVPVPRIGLVQCPLPVVRATPCLAKMRRLLSSAFMPPARLHHDESRCRIRGPYLPTIVADWITTCFCGTSLIGPREVVGVPSIFFTTSMPEVTLPNTA